MPLRQHFKGQELLQCYLRGSKQLSIKKDPVQCFLNTLGRTLNRSNPYVMFPERFWATLNKKKFWAKLS